MDSFFQRVSSIVSRHNIRFFDHNIHNGEDNERRQQFLYLAGRRCSAPEIRRYAVVSNTRLLPIPTGKGTSDEQIAVHSSTNILPRKHYNSTG